MLSMTMVFLWRHRERPQLLSRRWLAVWAKRGLQALPLVRVLLRRRYLLWRGASIGPRSVIQTRNVIGSPRWLSVGSDSVLCSDVHLALHNRISIGNGVVINERATLLTASHALRDPCWPAVDRPIRIDDHAWIATGAMLLPGVTIGRGAVVGAGAVVRCDVPDYALAVGNPATITPLARSQSLQYRPTERCAPYEAWLGPRTNP